MRRTGLGQLAVALIANRALSLGSVGVAIPALESTVDFYTKLGAEPFPDWSLPDSVVALEIVGPALERLGGGLKA